MVPPCPEILVILHHGCERDVASHDSGDVELNPPEVKPQSLQDYLAFYKEVEESVTEAWKKEGRHAYLHHLNAMFGYEPLRGSDGSEMKF
jgi:hypothetical protein